MLAVGAVGAVPAGAGPTADNAEFCDLYFEVSQLFAEAPDPDADPLDVEEFVAELANLISQAEAVAPPEVAAQVAAAAEKLRTTGAAALEDPELAEIGAVIDAYAFEACGYQTASVTATEYEFDGLPKKLETGPTVIELTNDGEEVHEIAVARIKGDRTIAEVVELPEHESEEAVAFVAHGLANQGDTSYVYLDLKKAGRYGAVCFIPVGTTDLAALEEEDHSGGGDAEPHSAEGMLQGFKVKKAKR